MKTGGGDRGARGEERMGKKIKPGYGEVQKTTRCGDGKVRIKNIL